MSEDFIVIINGDKYEIRGGCYEINIIDNYLIRGLVRFDPGTYPKLERLVAEGRCNLSIKGLKGEEMTLEDVRLDRFVANTLTFEKILN